MLNVVFGYICSACPLFTIHTPSEREVEIERKHIPNGTTKRIDFIVARCQCYETHITAMYVWCRRWSEQKRAREFIVFFCLFVAQHVYIQCCYCCYFYPAPPSLSLYPILFANAFISTLNSLFHLKLRTINHCNKGQATKRNKRA